MPTECNPELFEFTPVDSRAVVATFDGGAIMLDAGALLPGATGQALGLVERLVGGFWDHRQPELIEHEVRTLVG